MNLNDQYRAAAEANFSALFLLGNVRNDRGEVIDFAVRAVNAAAVEELGLSRQTLVGSTLSSLLQAAALPIQLDPFIRVSITGKPAIQELSLGAPHGKAKWVRQQVVATDDGIAIEWQDISAYKQSENRLADEAARRRVLFEQAKDGIFIVDDTSRRVVEANPSFARMLGYTGDEVVQLYPWDWDLTFSSREKVLARWPEPPEEKEIFESRFRRKDGTEFDAEVTLSPGEWPGQKQLLCICRDITEHKQTEHVLRERELRLRMTAQAGNVGFWDWDLRTNRVFFSPEWKSQIGYQDHEIGDGYAEWESRVHPDDLGRTLQFVRDFIEDPQVGYNVEFRLRHKDGSYRWILAQASLLHDEQGQPARMLGSHIDISERKRAEEAARQTDVRFRILFERAPVGVVVIDPDTASVIDCNEQAARQLGYSVEEFIRLGIADFEAVETREQTQAHIEKILRGGRHEFETKHRTKAGEVRDVWVSTQAIELSGRNVCHSILLDITERKRGEETLRESELRLRLAQELGHVGVWDWCPRTGKTTFSDEMNRIYGVPAGAIRTYQDWRGRVHPDDVQRIEAESDEALARHEPFDLKFRIVHASGEVRWISSVGGAEFDQNGQITRVLGINIDITELKRSDDAIRRINRTLQNVLDAASAVSIIAIDLEGVITLFNRGAERMSGYTAEEMVGKQTPIGLHLPVEIEARSRELSEELGFPVAGLDVFTTKPKIDGQELREWTCVRKDGTRIWISLVITTARAENGEITGYLGIAQDVTERWRAEQRERSRSQVLEQLAGNTPLPEILQTIVLAVEAENPAMLCSILLLDETGKHILTGAAPSLPDFYNAAIHGAEIGLGRGSCGTAAATGQRVIVEDVQRDPYWEPYRELAAAAGLRSCWSEPIRAASGQVLGTFAIYHRVVHRPDENEITLVEIVANLASIAIERKRLEEELQLAVSIYRNSSEAMMVLDADNRIVAINPAFVEITGYTLDEVIGRDPHLLSSGRQNEEFYREMWQALESEGRWQGELWNRRKNGQAYPQWLIINTIRNAGGVVHRRVGMFSDITERKQSEELIWRQANFDPLTQLPNRRMFCDRLDQDIRKAHRAHLPVALLFIDLDRFKEVNDTLGHGVGDLLLVEAARRITCCVRESDTVARLGGDEFTVTLAQLPDNGQIEKIANHIITRLAEPFYLGNERVHVSASIGITLYPNDADEVEGLLRNADQAMYVAKSAGRNCFRYFTPSLQEAAQARLRLINDLHGALGAGQFLVHFQPIVELATGRVIKAEALLRWRHPERGIIEPADFIPVAEETGLIVEIGDWVFREAIRWAKRWTDLCPEGFQVSVNKSPVQFRVHGSDHDAWVEYLRQLGLPGHCLCIEITESLLLDTTIARKLLKFRDAGIHVAIDDFGTGYSALSYLKKFHIDYLKIDKSFIAHLVDDRNDLALTEAITVMAHRLGLKVIAEGVETAEQKSLLATVGCDFGQGYLFAGPMPPEAFEAFLQTRK